MDTLNMVKQTMTRDRYFQILSNIHLSVNLSTPANNRDKICELRSFTSRLNDNFINLVWLLKSNPLMKVWWSSTLKQHNPKKPIERRFKLWSRADMSGYMYQFDVYQVTLTVQRERVRTGW
ncbi:hypothetical protein AVEN_102032-1 [Araneus ventricosus]|uniref:PiggyBac transposable element-derived protein domain-containing protein n=1 Tax=Araneus ventricosus TaxID=182803 RepID=A0A4Y1ZPQ3_ARAVE|nr:hypothetical protein AVEN_102032-1 [Araneus ventricosus]